MKTLKIVTAFITTNVVLFVLSSTSYAFDYYDDEALLFTYQNSAGYWFACGPVQCLSAGENSEERALDLISHDRHGPIDWIGSYGRCDVYAGRGDLESYDTQPSRIISRMEDRC